MNGLFFCLAVLAVFGKFISSYTLLLILFLSVGPNCLFADNFNYDTM